MEVDRDPERFGTLQDRPEEGVVQIAAPGVAVDQCSLEAVFTDHALELVGGGVRSHGRQRGEPREAARMAPHRLRQAVVRIAGERYRLGRTELLNARRG